MNAYEWVGLGIHWEMCKQLGFAYASEWYMDWSEAVLKNKCKVLRVLEM